MAAGSRARRSSPVHPRSQKEKREVPSGPELLQFAARRSCCSRKTLQVILLMCRKTRCLNLGNDTSSEWTPVIFAVLKGTLMVDPGGIANWSVTHVDWSEGKWHPRSYRAADVTYELFKNITSVNENFHKDGDDKRVATLTRCMWNRTKRPCYLFARKFYPEALNNLLKLFSSHTTA
ncbi:uncharacterized protein C2845_PM07G28480 [Panicum miliaceum]|uniref:Uncharacterized protein n=1 Tax=Panicum miliaceum TaxID=4540 RepID=A0A3L6SML3_PANMI|nr:uncharacterized protein C2845_PM07G28480 [Panicum miliaceum]